MAFYHAIVIYGRSPYMCDIVIAWRKLERLKINYLKYVEEHNLPFYMPQFLGCLIKRTMILPQAYC